MDVNIVSARCLNSAPKIFSYVSLTYCLQAIIVFFILYFKAGTFNNEVIPVTIPQKKGMMIILYRAYALACPAAMQIYWNKRM